MQKTSSSTTPPVWWTSTEIFKTGKIHRNQEEGGDNIRQAFTVFDQDGNGSISAIELKLVLQEKGIEMTDAEVAEAIREADTDGDGEIDYNEFFNVVTR